MNQSFFHFLLSQGCNTAVQFFHENDFDEETLFSTSREDLIHFLKEVGLKMGTIAKISSLMKLYIDHHPHLQQLYPNAAQSFYQPLPQMSQQPTPSPAYFNPPPLSQPMYSVVNPSVISPRLSTGNSLQRSGSLFTFNQGMQAMTPNAMNHMNLPPPSSNSFMLSSPRLSSANPMQVPLLILKKDAETQVEHEQTSHQNITVDVGNSPRKNHNVKVSVSPRANTTNATLKPPPQQPSQQITTTEPSNGEDDDMWGRYSTTRSMFLELEKRMQEEVKELSPSQLQLLRQQAQSRQQIRRKEKEERDTIKERDEKTEVVWKMDDEKPVIAPRLPENSDSLIALFTNLQDLECAAEEVKSNKEVVLHIFFKEKILAPEKKNTYQNYDLQEIYIQAVKSDRVILQCAPYRFKSDRILMWEACFHNYDNFKYANDELKQDKPWIRALIHAKCPAGILRYVDPNILKDRSLALEFVNINPDTRPFFPYPYREDTELVKITETNYSPLVREILMLASDKVRFEEMKKIADRSFTAAFHYGRFLCGKGLTLEINEEKGRALIANSIRVLEHITDINDPMVNFCFAYYYRYFAIPTDFQKAFQYANLLTRLDFHPGLNFVAYCYCNGEGVKKNQAKAIELYQKAADMGNALAMKNLGYSYQHGIGVTRDIRKANELYEKASQLGIGNASFNLAQSYLNGEGVPKNLAKAQYYFQKALEQGCYAAKDILVKYFKMAK